MHACHVTRKSIRYSSSVTHANARCACGYGYRMGLNQDPRPPKGNLKKKRIAVSAPIVRPNFYIHPIPAALLKKMRENSRVLAILSMHVVPASALYSSRAGRLRRPHQGLPHAASCQGVCTYICACEALRLLASSHEPWDTRTQARTHARTHTHAQPRTHARTHALTSVRMHSHTH